MSGKSKKTGNLVALGSAAVVAVYGAGFMRTAAAAQRFAAQADERVLSPEDAAAMLAEQAGSGAVSAAASVAGASDLPSTPAPVTGAPASNMPDVASPIAAPGKSDAATVKPQSVADAKPASATVSRSGDVSVPMPPEETTVITATGAQVASGGAAASATAATSSGTGTSTSSGAASTPAPATVSAPTTVAATPTPKPVAEKPVASAPAPAAPASPPPATSAAATPAPTTAAAAPVDPNAPVRWKDGEFTGYGTSRHGDVEVYLETTDGKITYIKISQCLTQYSCSWIADLPRQVLARQSTRVDAVSGATVSANAFYYAVVAALAKAR